MKPAALLYECKVDIGPHFFIPRLEGLQVWQDRLVFQRETPLQVLFSATLVAFVSPMTVLGVAAGLANLLSFKSHRVISAVGLALGLIVIATITLLTFA